MSTLRVNNIQFNPDGNTIISAVNTNNIVITVDGTEKIKVAKDGVNFRGPISVNNTPIFGGAGEFIATINLANQVSNVLNVGSGGTGLTAVGTSGNMLVSNGTAFISSNTIISPIFTANISANGSIRTNIVSLPNTSANIDCSLSNYFTKTSNSNATWNISNVPSSQAYSFLLELTNGGANTQTWFANTKWPGGTAPTLTTSGVDLLGFITDDGGANWRGVQLMKDSK